MSYKYYHVILVFTIPSFGGWSQKKNHKVLKSKIVLAFGRRIPMSILLNANIVISNEPFQHIYSINIATLESAMNDNSFLLPSCSDSRRRTRRLTTETDINFSCVRHFVHPALFGCTYLHHRRLSMASDRRYDCVRTIVRSHNVGRRPYSSACDLHPIFYNSLRGIHILCSQ